jgi:hypothetical protein
MHHPPIEGNLCDECGNTVKSAIVEDYNRFLRYGDKSDYMINSYFVNRCMWKQMKRFFSCLLDLSVLNSCRLYIAFVGIL